MLKLDPKSSAVNGVLIHAFFTQGEDGGDKAFLLDMNPGGNFEDAALDVGKSYTFFGTSTTLSVLLASPSGAQIKISGATGGATGGAGNRVVVMRSNKWDVVDAGDGAFSLRSVNSGKCLDVSGGNTGDNVPMVQWDCHGGTNQQFRKQ